MEQSIAGTSGAIIPNTISNPVETQKATDNEVAGENTDLNSVAPFLQLLNQQITLLTTASESVDENKNGLSKQNQITAMVKELSEIKGVLPNSGVATGKIDLDFEGELKNKISDIGLKESFQGIEKEQLFKNEDSKNNVNKLSDQILKANNLKILENQNINGNASKLSAGNLADKSGLVNMDALQTISSNMAEKLKNVSKENNIFAEKYNQDISSNSVSATNNGIAKVSSIDDISAEQIINRVVSGIKENVSADGGRIKITLSPPSLGTLEMDVTVRNNKVEVIITADNKDVQQSLNTHLDRLKGSLLNQGLTIDRCDVLMQNNREDYQQNYGQQTFYRDGSEKSSNNSKEKYSEELKPIMPIKSQIRSSPSLNPDNISIFA
jgi:flagellar hook-length control protein FliK